jgi:DNA-binding MarR family transcriptional regulator
VDAVEPSSITTDCANVGDLTLRVSSVLRELAAQNRRNEVDRIYAGGPTWAQNSLLYTLLMHGRTRLHDLARLERISRPSMTIAVGRLRKRGLVNVTRDARDLRGKWVEITETGVQIHQLSNKKVRAALAVRLEALCVADREALALATPVLERIADFGNISESD